MSEKTNRLEHIDFLKGVAIFLMIMGHALSWSYPETIQRTPDNALIRNLIYAFHMPLFFFLSGYVIDLKNKYWDTIICKKIISKRVISLLVPCITWYIISSFNDIPWFLRALFLMIIMFSILKYLTRRIQSFVLESTIILVVGYVILFILTQITRDTQLDYIFNLTVAQIHYPYFAIGYLFQKKEITINILYKNYIYTCCILLFCSCFYAYNWTSHSHAIHAILRYILAFSGIAIAYIYTLTIKTYNTITNKVFIYLGKRSIEIYLLSTPFILHAPHLFEFVLANNKYPGNIVAQALFGFALSIPAILFCIIITKLIGHSNILRFVLFGKK